MLKTLWKYRHRLSWMTLKDYLRCRKDMKAKSISDIPLFYMSEEDIRDLQQIFKDKPTFAEVFGVDEEL